MISCFALCFDTANRYRPEIDNKL